MAGCVLAPRLLPRSARCQRAVSRVAEPPEHFRRNDALSVPRPALTGSRRYNRHGCMRYGRRTAFRRSADCPVYQYRSKSSQAATIFIGRFSPSSPHDAGVGRGPRRGAPPSSPQPSPPSDGGEGEFGCRSAALRCVAGCQPAVSPTASRPVWRSNDRRIRNPQCIAARRGRKQVGSQPWAGRHNP